MSASILAQAKRNYEAVLNETIAQQSSALANLADENAKAIELWKHLWEAELNEKLTKIKLTRGGAEKEAEARAEI